MTTILLLSVAGAVIAAIVGSLWYSMATPMGKIHMRYIGMDKLTEQERKKKMEAAKPTMWMIYGAQLILSFLTAFWVVFVITESVQNGLPLMMAVGFPLLSWLCFIVPTIGSGLLWSSCDGKTAWQEFVSHILCNLVTILLIAFMTSFFL